MKLTKKKLLSAIIAALLSIIAILAPDVYDTIKNDTVILDSLKTTTAPDSLIKIDTTLVKKDSIPK